MLSRRLPATLFAPLLLAACGSTTVPAPAVSDAGNAPTCPVGPTGPTGAVSALPSGACKASDGPCNYRATPCPSVANGEVNGYLCDCASGAWDCEVVVQSGVCAPLPGFDGAATLMPVDSGEPTGPTGPTGPMQP